MLTGSPVFQVLAGFAALMLVVLWALNEFAPAGSEPPTEPATALRRAIGAQGIHGFWLALAALLWVALFLILFVGLLATIWAVIDATIPADIETAEGKSAIWEFRFLVAKLGGLTAVLGAVVALPFTLIRLRLSNEENETKKSALYNDKINAALADLHAQRQVSKPAGDSFVAVWEDDITRRNGAIDRLEALAHEDPDYAPRISRMLCTYLRELSREHPAKKPPEGADPAALHEWARKLTPARSDMENAAQTIGRLTEIEGVTAETLARSLQGANLQGFTLHELNFEKSNMSKAHLEGANLGGAHLEGANLGGAHLEGAFLGRAHFDQSTDLTAADTTRAAVRSVDWTNVDISQSQVNAMFGDRSADLPKGITRPERRPDGDLDWGDFYKEWELFKADPDGYVPPQDR